MKNQNLTTITSNQNNSGRQNGSAAAAPAGGSIRLKKRLQLAGAALLPILVAGPVSATITNGIVTGGTALTAGGVFVKLTPPLANPFGPPNSVGNDTFQSPNLFGFDEDQNILLAAPLVVDVGSSPIPAG